MHWTSRTSDGLAQLAAAVPGSRRRRPDRHPGQCGFTLIELLVVVVVAGVLSISVLQFISAPIDAYVAQDRRTRLVDIAQSALHRIARDVQQALPNSIRVGCAGECVELLRVVTGGRYRAGLPGDTLSIVPTDADSAFDVLGPLNNLGGLSTSASATACVNGSAACVAIYNTGQAGTDAWNRDHIGGGWKPDNLATLTAISAASVAFDNTNFSTGDSAFPAHSPGQRFFIVDSPVSFLCDTGAGTLRRYEGYNITHPHSSVDEHAELTGLGNPAEHALVADQVSACSFSYTAGSPSRNALLTVAITVAEAGEDITLLQQVNVPNLP